MGQRRDWAKTLDELEQSGLSVKAFAQQIGCSTTSLYHYKNLRAETRQLSVRGGEVVSFELKTETPKAQEEVTTLRYGELELSLPELPHPLWLATLMKELKR
jgi:transposase-like protein